MALRNFLPVHSNISSTSSAAATVPFTVISYNILANKYAISGYHDYCLAAFLDLAYRAPKLIQELLHYNADIVSLQEVEKDFLEEELGPTLSKHGYDSLYYGRARKPSDPVPGPEEGVCLLYKRDRFTKEASKTVRFGDNALKTYQQQQGVGGSPGDGRNRNRQSVSGFERSKFWSFVDDREDGAVLALLKDKQVANRSLVACATHLFWNPHYPDVKLAQAHILCDAISSFLTQHSSAAASWRVGTGGRSVSNAPVVIAGDFNSLPIKTVSDAFDKVPPGGSLTSGVYTLLSQGNIPCDHHDHPSARQSEAQQQQQQPHDSNPALAKFQFHSSGLDLTSTNAVAYQGQEPILTTKTTNFQGCLDYLWVGSGAFKVQAVLEMPFEPVVGDMHVGNNESKGGENEKVSCEEFEPCPNEKFPSDHLAVGAQLQWT